MEIEQAFFAQVVRQNYLGKDLAAIIMTEACIRAGHPARIDKPYELKQEFERGCVCGTQRFA